MSSNRQTREPGYLRHTTSSALKQSIISEENRVKKQTHANTPCSERNALENRERQPKQNTVKVRSVVPSHGGRVTNMRYTQRRESSVKHSRINSAKPYDDQKFNQQKFKDIWNKHIKYDSKKYAHSDTLVYPEASWEPNEYPTQFQGKFKAIGGKNNNHSKTINQNTVDEGEIPHDSADAFAFPSSGLTISCSLDNVHLYEPRINTPVICKNDETDTNIIVNGNSNRKAEIGIDKSLKLHKEEGSTKSDEDDAPYSKPDSNKERSHSYDQNASDENPRRKTGRRNSDEDGASYSKHDLNEGRGYSYDANASNKKPRPKEVEMDVFDKDVFRNSPNLYFYRNEMKSKPGGYKVEEMLAWHGKYNTLEGNHSFIQWLFPTEEQSFVNTYAQPIQLHEAEEIREDPEVQSRYLRAYKMMLDFYGLKLKSAETGEVEKSKNWSERLNHLNRSKHNQFRVTRIIRSLAIFGFGHFQNQLLTFLMNERAESGILDKIGDSTFSHWFDAVANTEDEERNVVDNNEYLSKEVDTTVQDETVHVSNSIEKNAESTALVKTCQVVLASYNDTTIVSEHENDNNSGDLEGNKIENNDVKEEKYKVDKLSEDSYENGDENVEDDNRNDCDETNDKNTKHKEQVSNDT